MATPRAQMIIWEDAVQPTAHWRPIDELRRPRPLRIVSLGFVVRRSRRAVLLAQSLDEGSQNGLGILTIPTSAIIQECDLW